MEDHSGRRRRICRGQIYETAERQRSQTLNTRLQGTLSTYSNTVALTDIQEHYQHTVIQ